MSTNESADLLKKEQKELTSKDYYFDSYAHFGIHEEMIKDTVRTESYRKAIMQNKHLFNGKIVLDVGCGTGILSMFAAQAGAKHVYAIECSAISNQAKEIVKANNFDDTITVIQGKVEEIDLPVDKVDIIISEWMGYFLLYESMLNTVLYARDKWLAKDGMILPDKATMFVAGIEDGEYKDDKINWWDSVYGFDMSCIKKIAILEPLVDIVPAETIVSNTCKFFEIDIMTVKEDELSFVSDYQIEFGRNDFCHALVVWFDCYFSQGHKTITLSTSPLLRQTHWKQTVFYFDEVITAKKGEKLSGKITMKPNKGNHRDLDISITYKMDGSFSKIDRSYDYRLR